MAITSDAIHDLGDSISLGMAWYFQKLSNKKPTKTPANMPIKMRAVSDNLCESEAGSAVMKSSDYYCMYEISKMNDVTLTCIYIT